MRNSAQLFKALADETRLRIVHLLVRGELCVCEITKVLNIGQSKASRHLGILRNLGLVRDRREGQWMYYSLAKPHSITHQWILKWLAKAESEIPQAATDLTALDKVCERGELCGPLCARERAPAPRLTAAAMRSP